MKDLSGQRFGRLVAVKPFGKNKYGNILWLCKCDCGNEHIVSSGKLVQGKSKSCGCYRKENSTKLLEKHGITTGGKPRTFIIWSGMKARCYNLKSTSYKSYGGRGIRICDEWLGKNGFKNFHEWAMANGYKEDFEIDRINGNGNYEPSNCQWIPKHENRTKQRNAKYFEVNGKTLNISQWCRELGISRSLAYKNLALGEKSFTNFLEERLSQVKGKYIL